MGAETDLPPPVPEPTLSPEPDIRHDDTKDWRAALGESVSFGRFLTEPLEWSRWSAFDHNRYLEEAARQARPGSVAQKKAMFEARYARKRRMEADAAAAAGVEGDREADLADVVDGGGAASLTSSAAGSSCMTDETATEQEVSGGGGYMDDEVECGGGDSGCDATAVVAAEEVEVIANLVGSACKMDEAKDEIGNRASNVSQSQEKQDLCTNHLVPVDTVEERQPLTECSIVNQDITDSAKKRRLQMLSLFQKPAKLSSPSSGKKGRSSSEKRRSALHSSSKENALPPSSTDSSKRGPTSVPKKRPTHAALQMSMSFTGCERGNAASISRNLGTTIAQRISQLHSASRQAENTEPEIRAPRKVSCRAVQEIAPRASQLDEQRSSHVMTVKQKLFGSISPLMTQKTRSTREKQKKIDNEPGSKESRPSFCFKTRQLPNFGWKNKLVKDSNQQNAREDQHLPNSGHLLSDVSQTHQMGKGVSKDKQICCFPIRKLY